MVIVSKVNPVPFFHFLTFEGPLPDPLWPQFRPFSRNVLDWISPPYCYFVLTYQDHCRMLQLVARQWNQKRSISASKRIIYTV